MSLIQARDPLTLICSSEACPGQGWIEDQIPPMVDYQAARWPGAWDHGLRQDLKIVGIGCAYPAGAFGGQVLTWRQVARRQMLASFAPSRLGPAVDGQGVTSDQAAGYAHLTYGRVRTRRSCRPSSIRSLILTPPIVPAAFSQPDTVAVLTARLLPAPRRILTPIDRQGARTLMRLPVKCVGPCGMKFGLPAGWKSMLARPLS